ncbi:PTS ascorbate transporter subunit IIC [Treponema phagedenis]|uniref:Ascorbate-specific PTS system EIIC component n=1 Tax=Treponema phagedenis TaxID=162 RepID=A0A0B7GXV0_TREPH|nr:PTS ascorbate transporter subunit IIC [Treponema phagedenis]NVP24381.1 PTS ascorbate transporter subunit IIC [Treponema phagedenis]QEJ96079.1 PTS ascorbate transporter subunit IIC [Treponema phagedenis]QEJ99022.1 PTS ascorbate transporter subunit IIC [Treponema phagedenis]QEK01842.1 PTS ascorbate transporter subunit IIC [Treponema phagedenis]QEK04532.1 PTS ascorbate transporter subunit IIC [Treponema phagedenis]
MNFFRFLMNDVLSVPAVLVGLVALVGLLIQKKDASECIKGFIKSILGFLVLGAGAGVIVGSLGHFSDMFQYGFNIHGVVPNNEAIVAIAQNTLGSEMALIMFFGMFANILIARFTPLKYIFLTGHHTIYMAILISVILSVGGLSGWPLVVIGSVMLGFTMALMPAWAQPVMKKITGSDEIAFGHFGTFGYMFAAYIGKLVGKNSKSTEEIQFPKWLVFFRDTSVAISVTMGVIFIFSAIFAGPTYIQEKLSGGQNFIVFAILQAITFAGGVFIVLSGVRLVLGEIVPAFTGISKKLVPNAKPALDCPVVFPYAPNAVLIGFMSSFIGGIIGMFVCIAFKLPVIIPGVVPHFFCGASAGVFANATGGRRGCVIGSFAHGLLITFLPILLMPLLGSLGFAGATFSDTDFCTVGILLGGIIKLFR